jgi:O-antigen/teichoic acid export membrane protein
LTVARSSVKLLPRLRQIAMVGSVETFGVAIGGIAGLLIVNVLPKDQYAAYTFLVACMTLILGVTDLGLAHCCMPIVGQRANERPWVVGVCHQVFRKRWVLLALGLVLVGPYWYYSSQQHGWSGAAYLAGSLLMVSVVLLTLREHYANTVLLILSQIGTLNRIALASHSVRIAFVGAVLLLPVTSWSMVGIVAATAAASFVSVLLYRKAFRTQQVPDADLDAGDSKKVDAEILRIAKPLVLPGVFYQVQGVITVFLVSLFGTSSMLAEVGAFGRLAMVLMVVDRVTNVLLFPAIARAPMGPRLGSIVAQAHLAYFAMGAAVLLTSVVFPQYWILLLGKQYESMTPLVWMVFLASIVMNASGFAFRTLSVRGATAGQTYSIPVTLITQVLYLWLVGVSDLRSVLWFGIATSLANFGYEYALLAARWVEWRKDKPPADDAQPRL